MHFVEIYDYMRNNFGEKRIFNIQSVTNVLTRYKDFVLVGRGVYGLNSWYGKDFLRGSVIDIIEKILSKNKRMTMKEIRDIALIGRYVKQKTIDSTIYQKPQFVRDEDGKFYLDISKKVSMKRSRGSEYRKTKSLNIE
jgi:hypothetical protein